MPYTTRVRGLNYRSLGGQADIRNSTNGPILHSDWSVRYAELVEYVYSWRTGANSASDVAPSPDQDGWGIKGPRESGSLVDKLADRKRYYEEVMRAAFPAELASGALSTNRTSSSDSGHLFAKATALRRPITCHYDMTTQGSDPRFAFETYYGTCTLSQVASRTPVVQNHGWVSYPLLVTSGSLTTPVQRQGTANAFFSETAPERPTAHILTTVVELLRGDVPSLLKNYHRALFRYQSKLRSLQYAGSEYLNIEFGWKPLLMEYANMIKVFIGLDRMVYSESNRRHRYWAGPSATTVVEQANVAHVSSPFSGGGENFQVSSGTPNVGNPGTWSIRTSDFISEDYKFSSRYSALVKPNHTSVGFVERAEEVLRQLGLVDDPTILWELTPWSWLVDWAANIGNSISNAHTLSPISGRHAVDYAYLTTQLTRVMEETPVAFNSYGSYFTGRFNYRLDTPKGYHSTVSRVRDRATPFGFGTQLGSLTSPQYAILVALGLARTR